MPVPEINVEEAFNFELRHANQQLHAAAEAHATATPPQEPVSYEDMSIGALTRVVATAEVEEDKTTELNAGEVLLEKLGELPDHEARFDQMLLHKELFKKRVLGVEAPKVTKEDEPKPVVQPQATKPKIAPAVKKAAPKPLVQKPIKQAVAPAPKQPDTPAQKEAAKKPEKDTDPNRVYNGIYGVFTVGNSDPLERARSGETRSPEVLYHASKDPVFSFDEMFDGGRVGVGNNILGDGLYCGPQVVAEGYAEYFRRNGYSAPSVTKLYPYQAKILNLTFPQPPMSDMLLQEFTSFIKNQRLTADNREGLIEAHNRLRRQENGNRSPITDFLNDYRMSGLAQEFLMSKGIDGVASKLRMRSPIGTNVAMVFWRHDRVGDVATWEQRAKTQQVIDHIGQSISRHVSPNNTYETAEQTPFGGEIKKLVPQSLTQNEARDILRSSETSLAINAETAQRLWSYLGRNTVNPLAAVAELANTSEAAAKLLSASVGVHEGYTLHEHTQAVLGQFEKHFKHYFEGDSAERQNARAFLRTVLLLQDIGKPIHTVDRRHSQEAYNSRIAEVMLKNFPISSQLKSFMKTVIGQDLLGTAIKDKTAESEEFAAQRLIAMSEESDVVSKKEMIAIAEVLYKSDASAYTADATYMKVMPNGIRRQYCIASLDYLFRKSKRASVMKIDGIGEGVAKRIRRRVQDAPTGRPGSSIPTLTTGL